MEAGGSEVQGYPGLHETLSVRIGRSREHVWNSIRRPIGLRLGDGGLENLKYEDIGWALSIDSYCLSAEIGTS